MECLLNERRIKSVDFKNGMKDGIPIAIGYLSVSFTFGIMAIAYGFTWWQALLISMTNLTSAGQFAGIGIMLGTARYFEMIITQLTINIRYSFMGISLSQKVDSEFKGIYRWILGMGTTDEIFAVAMTKDEVSKEYYAGLISIPYIGWSMGTLLGAIMGNVLPHRIVSALGLAIYGMFVAIIVPEMKKVKEVVYVVAIAVILSMFFYYVLPAVSSGIAMTICAIAAAACGAVFLPREETEDE